MRNSVEKSWIESRIKDVTYHVLPGTTCTICNIEMVNGFSIRGESACVDPAKFDEALGRRYAYEQAFDKIWAFEGYLLAEERWRAGRGDTNQYAEEQRLWHVGLKHELMDTLGLDNPAEIVEVVKGMKYRLESLDK